MNKQNHSHAPVARRGRAVVTALLLAATTALAHGQVVGSTVVATAVMEVREVASGWSAVRQVIGRSVVNEHGDVLGTVDDLVVAPDASVSHVIVGAPTGFLGLHRHEVAVPASLLLLADDKLLLVGARPGSIELMSPFEYAR